MRHRISGKKLGRGRQGRAILLRNLAIAFIRHDRVTTTERRAAVLRMLIEKLAATARKGTIASARHLHDTLQHPEATRQFLHRIVGIAAPTPLVRLVKSSIRRGDSARLATLMWIGAEKKIEVPVDQKKEAA